MSSLSHFVKHLKPCQVADRWHITAGTLERWRTQGTGPLYVRLPGRVIYRLEDIEAFEQRELRRSTSERVQTDKDNKDNKEAL